MNEAYYYLRKRKPSGGMHRCAVVYLVEKDNQIGKGIAICNEEDAFSRGASLQKDKNGSKRHFKGGLKLARSRAVKALMTKESSEIIKNHYAFDKVREAIDTGQRPFKSIYAPSISQFEQKLLHRNEANK
jgi:hypothetical protein